jgi:serine/threonine-protein kinase PknG
VSSALAVVDRAARITALGLVCKQFPKSREARLRLAAAMSDVSGEPGASGPGKAGIPEASAAGAEQLLQALGTEDPWDWRVLWFQARVRLAQGKPAEARKLFDQVYFDLPGDLAPKLALGLAAELASDLPIAAKMYELVSRTNPEFVSAVFGLARCRYQEGDRKAAVAALSRIPASSALFVRSRVEAARLLVQRDPAIPAPTLEDLASASSLAESLPLTGMSKWTLQSLIFSSAVAAAGSHAVPSKGGASLSTPDARILGQPLESRSLSQGLESAFRSMARFVSDGERIRLVDQANQVRPRTLI